MGAVQAFISTCISHPFGSCSGPSGAAASPPPSPPLPFGIAALAVRLFLGNCSVLALRPLVGDTQDKAAFCLRMYFKQPVILLAEGSADAALPSARIWLLDPHQRLGGEVTFLFKLRSESWQLHAEHPAINGIKSVFLASCFIVHLLPQDFLSWGGWGAGPHSVEI